MGARLMGLRPVDHQNAANLSTSAEARAEDLGPHRERKDRGGIPGDGAAA